METLRLSFLEIFGLTASVDCHKMHRVYRIQMVEIAS